MYFASRGLVDWISNSMREGRDFWRFVKVSEVVFSFYSVQMANEKCRPIYKFVKRCWSRIINEPLWLQGCLFFPLQNLMSFLIRSERNRLICNLTWKSYLKCFPFPASAMQPCMWKNSHSFRNQRQNFKYFICLNKQHEWGESFQSTRAF